MNASAGVAVLGINGIGSLGSFLGMRVHRLGNACLGRLMVEMIRKGNIVVSGGIGGAGVGMLRDKLILIVVSSGLALWALVPCRGLMRVRGGRGDWELLVLFVGSFPVMIALCLRLSPIVRIIEGRRSADHRW